MAKQKDLFAPPTVEEMGGSAPLDLAPPAVAGESALFAPPTAEEIGSTNLARALSSQDFVEVMAKARLRRQGSIPLSPTAPDDPADYYYDSRPQAELVRALGLNPSMSPEQVDAAVAQLRGQPDPRGYQGPITALAGGFAKGSADLLGQPDVANQIDRALEQRFAPALDSGLLSGAGRTIPLTLGLAAAARTGVNPAIGRLGQFMPKAADIASHLAIPGLMGAEVLRESVNRDPAGFFNQPGHTIANAAIEGGSEMLFPGGMGALTRGLRPTVRGAIGETVGEGIGNFASDLVDQHAASDSTGKPFDPDFGRAGRAGAEGMAVSAILGGPAVLGSYQSPAPAARVPGELFTDQQKADFLAKQPGAQAPVAPAPVAPPAPAASADTTTPNDTDDLVRQLNAAVGGESTAPAPASPAPTVPPAAPTSTAGQVTAAMTGLGSGLSDAAVIRTHDQLVSGQSPKFTSPAVIQVGKANPSYNIADDGTVLGVLHPTTGQWAGIPKGSQPSPSQGSQTTPPAAPAAPVYEAPPAPAAPPIPPSMQAFPADSGTLGIPRTEMPQVRGSDRPELLEFLGQNGTTSERVSVPVADIKPTQAEFDPRKVGAAGDYGKTGREVIISSDNHIIDGHHQWMAAKNDIPNGNITVIRINAPIREALQKVASFPKAGKANQQRVAPAQTTPSVAAAPAQAAPAEAEPSAVTQAKKILADYEAKREARLTGASPTSSTQPTQAAPESAPGFDRTKNNRAGQPSPGASPEDETSQDYAGQANHPFRLPETADVATKKALGSVIRALGGSNIKGKIEREGADTLAITGAKGAKIKVKIASQADIDAVQAEADRAAGGKAEGIPSGWYDKDTGTIYLTQNTAGSFTFDHEVIHAFKLMGLITAAEHAALVRIAKRNAEIVASVNERYAGATQEVRDEEYVAHLFERIADGRIKLPSLGTWQKIKDFLRDLGHVLTGGMIEQSERGLVRDVAEGKPLGRKPTAPVQTKPTKSVRFKLIKDMTPEELQAREEEVDDLSEKAVNWDYVYLGMTLREHEAAFLKQMAEENDAENWERYKKVKDTLGGKILNADDVRELYAPYADSIQGRTLVSGATQEGASAFIKRMIANKIESPAVSKSRLVLAMAGGGGSGKGTVRGAFLGEVSDESDFIIDATFAKFDKGVKTIDAILAKGRDVVFAYIDAAPVIAGRRAWKRLIEDGRRLPTDVLAEAHAGANDAILRLAEHYRGNPRVTIKFYDTTGASPSEISLEEMQKRRHTAIGGSLQDTKVSIEKEVTDDLREQRRGRRELRERSGLDRERTPAVSERPGDSTRPRESRTIPGNSGQVGQGRVEAEEQGQKATRFSLAERFPVLANEKARAEEPNAKELVDSSNELAAEWQAKLPASVKVIMGGSLVSRSYVQAGDEPVDMDVRFLTENPERDYPLIEQATGLKLRKTIQADNYAAPGEPRSQATAYMVEGPTEYNGIAFDVEASVRNPAYVGWGNFYPKVMTNEEMARFRGGKERLKKVMQESGDKADKAAYKAFKGAVLEEVRQRAEAQGLVENPNLTQEQRAGEGPRFSLSEPGKDVEQKNRLGLEPDLRVAVTGENLPDKPLILQDTNAKNAVRQIDSIDGILAKFPNAAESPEEWAKMTAHAFATNDVPVPPYAFIRDLNGDGAAEKLRSLSPGQVSDARKGLAQAQELRRMYLDDEMTPSGTAKLFLWSFLSRGVSPYVQESLFIDAFPGIKPWVDKAAAGNFTEADFAPYEAWAKSAAPKGSGQPGAGATHNLNAYGRRWLFEMGKKMPDGRSKLQYIHDMLADPEKTGAEIRREYARIGQGAGIDNKVVSFTLLVAGYKDLMVLDRVQMRQLWDDGRFSDRNLYDGRNDADGNRITGSGINELSNGARGLLYYEAIERALSEKIDSIYADVGRPDDASIGQYHWESWVSFSKQEAGHGTLGAVLSEAKGEPNAIEDVRAKEGEYGAFAYGAKYGTRNGVPQFTYRVMNGPRHTFSVPAFREFLDAIKRPSNKVVPTNFKVSEAGNAPWYMKEGVSRARLNALAEKYADLGAKGAKAGESTQADVEDQLAGRSVGGETDAASGKKGVGTRFSQAERTPELQQAAQRLKDGEITREDYERLVNEHKPVKPYAEVPEPATTDEMREALTSDKAQRVGNADALAPGTPVGLRLDIPAYQEHGVWIVSVHEQQGGFGAGKSVGYASTASAGNVTFGAVENAALNIATGKPKSTIATMKGEWIKRPPAVAKALADKALNDPAWSQVGMDPERHSYFYDRETMQPVIGASEVIQVGPLVLAKNVKYGDKKDFRFSQSEKPRGRPDLANPAITGQGRELVDDVDEIRNQLGEPGVRRDREVEKEARDRFREAPDVERRKLLDKIKEGGQLDDVETRLAHHLINRDGLAALAGKDPNKLAAVQHLVWAYRQAGSEQARAFRQRRDRSASPEDRLNLITQAILSPPAEITQKIKELYDEGNPQQAEKVMRTWANKAKETVEKLKAQGVDLNDLSLPTKLTDPVQAARLLNRISAARARWGDMVMEYFMNSILSGPKTHIVNASGNALSAAWEGAIQRPVEALVGQIPGFRGKADITTFGEVKGVYRAILRSIPKAMNNAFRSCQAETDIMEFERTGMATQNKLAEGSRGPAIPGLAGRVIRTPFRSLAAGDSLAKTIIAHAEVAALAYRRGKEQGLKGNALEAHVSNELADPKSPVWEDALVTAKELSFQKEMEGGVARGITAIRNFELPGGIKPLAFKLPFIRTPWNIFATGLRKSPLGSISLGAKLIRKGLRAGSKNNDGTWDYPAKKMAHDVAEQLIAFGAMAALFAAMGNDDEDKDTRPSITGSGTQFGGNTGQRQYEQRAEPPMSIKIGKTWYDYSRIEPVSTALGAMVDVAQAIRSDKPITQQAGEMVSKVAGQVQNKTFLEGLSDTINLVSDPERNAERFATGLVTGFIPNIIRQPLRSGQEFVPETKALAEVAGESPALIGMRRLGQGAYPLESLGPVPKVDLWGRDIRRYPGPTGSFLGRVMQGMSPIGTRDDTATDLDLWLREWNDANPELAYWPQAPQAYRTVKGKRIEYTEDEYHDFMREAGELAVRRAERLLRKPADEDDIKELKSILEDARARVRNRMDKKTRQMAANK